MSKSFKDSLQAPKEAQNGSGNTLRVFIIYIRLSKYLLQNIQVENKILFFRSVEEYKYHNTLFHLKIIKKIRYQNLVAI